MFLFKGGQMVEKGIYWDPNTSEKIILENDGFLPVCRDKIYYKVPESYILIPILMFGLALSMAFPYGIGVAIFGLMYVSYIILYSLSNRLEKLFAKLIANMLVEYRPYISYFLGSSRRTRRRKTENHKKKD